MMQQLSQRERTMVYSALVAVVAVALWLGVIEPYRASMVRLDSQIKSRSNSLVEVTNLQQEIRHLRQQLSEVSGRKEMEGPLFSHVEMLTEQAGVRDRLLSMRPQQSSQQGNYRQQQVELKLEKLSITQLVRFLYAIEYSAQGVQVKSMRIKRRFEDHSSLDVNLSLFSLEQS